MAKKYLHALKNINPAIALNGIVGFYESIKDAYVDLKKLSKRSKLKENT